MQHYANYFQSLLLWGLEFYLSLAHFHLLRCPKAVVLFEESAGSFFKPALLKPYDRVPNFSKKVSNCFLVILPNSF